MTETLVDGTHFPSRDSIMADRYNMRGISVTDGYSDAIVVSGGYEDDEDHGDVIIYTGEGGRGSDTAPPSDQTLTGGNLALAKNCDAGQPVPVFRGGKHRGPYSPTEKGYRYDGLYRVEEYWHERGKNGFLIYRYRLVKDSGEKPPANPAPPTPAPPAPTGPARRVETTIQRIVRSTVVASK